MALELVMFPYTVFFAFVLLSFAVCAFNSGTCSSPMFVIV